MPYLLNVVYLGLIAILSPWLLFNSLRKGKYRAGVAEKWFGRVPIRSGERPCIWLHAVSVGEVNLLAPLLQRLQAAHPDWEYVISATSATGYALAKQKYAAHEVFYAPLDFTWAVKNAFRRLRPDVLILAELELWPNLLWAAQRHGAKVAIFNGRLSENSFRGYRRLRPLVRRVLQNVDLVAAQNETYAERFRQLGAPRVEVTGSLKFDGAEASRENPRTHKLAALAGIPSRDLVFLAGSTQAPEEELALASYLALREAFPKLRLILVPRHPERFHEVAELLKRSGVNWEKRSRLENRKPSDAARVLLVDVVGELGAWWGTAHIGFVGGSLLNPRGGQNMIEPAAYGVATCFGPSTRNFRDVVQLFTANNAAIVVHSGEELTRFVRQALQDRSFREQLGARAQELVRSQQGATERTLALLEEYCLPAKNQKTGRQAA
jgi:3-deoxy-D-manno-octulosonic-acid transferase